MSDIIVENELGAFGYHQQLKGSLTAWQLTAFGLNYMIPIAPAVIFGFILQLSGGSVALPYLLAGIGMSFTAISYGVLVQQFPMAGSLYSYVSRGLNPHIGFLAGWVLLLDYLLIPTVTSMSASIYIQKIFPEINYTICLILFTIVTGLLNLFGVNFLAKLSLWFLLTGELVIIIGFGVWSYSIKIHGTGVGHLLSMEPFKFQSIATLSAATSLAISGYLGFDAISTLAEEAKNPKRDIPKAIFWSVIIGGTTMFITGYLATLVIPNWQQFSHDKDWLGSTLFYVAEMTGGKWFTWFYTAEFLLAMAVFNMVATAAGSRLLFGMGRDGVLSKKIFSAINKQWNTPHWNIILIVLIECTIGVLATIDQISELVNYGALLGFILLNFTVIWFYYVRQKNKSKNIFKNFIFPVLGLFSMLWMFVNMQRMSLLFGSAWLLCGIIYGAYQSTTISTRITSHGI